MTVKEEKRKVPKLRFPGFTGEWEERKLGELFNQISMYIDPQDAKVELWSLTIEKGLTPKNDRYNRDFLVKKNDKFKVVSPNNFIYNPMNMTLGAIGYNETNKTVAVSGYYIVMKANNSVDNIYMKTWMKTRKAINLYKLYATGSLIEKQRLQFPNFSMISFLMPSIPEQQYIGSFFQTLDNRITLHQRKLTHLQLKKKGLLQKMFPRDGERVPELRFPGFTDEWEQRKLGEEFEKVNERNDGSFGRDHWISVAKMYFQNPEKVQSNNIDTRTYIMRKGDIAFEGHPNADFKFGRFVANDIGAGVVSELFPIYRHKQEYDNNYWKSAIQLEYIMAPIYAHSITSSGNSSNKLDSKHFLRQIIFVPKLEEQKKIGSFLANFDNLITLHQRKLDHLHLQKKALLQQMFV